MVERWSSKPYAWVRFLLPLRSISFTSRLKHSKISQHNYFDNKLKHPLKKLNSYNAFLGKLFSKKQARISRIYFRPITQVAKSIHNHKPGLFFRKFNLRTTQLNHHFSINQTHFQMFLNSQRGNTIGISNSVTYNPLLSNNTALTNISRSWNLLRILGNSKTHLLSPLHPQTILKSPKSSKLLKAYYTHLQPKSIRFITHFQLLKKLTSRYGFVRKIQNNWENFLNQKNQLSRFAKYNTPTLSLAPSVKYSSAFPRTINNAQGPLTKPIFTPSTPLARSTNLFNKLFAKSLFTSFLIYKRFYLSSPLLTERPDKLLLKHLYLTPNNTNVPFSNIICADLPKTPKLFLNLKSTKMIKFQTNFLCWYNFLLIRFLQHTTGLKASLMFNPYLHKSLSLTEQAQLDLWTQRVKGFQRIIGPKISLKESLQVTYISLKLKDPTLLSSWLSRTIHKVSFWKYRAFFRYLKFLLQNLFLPSFSFLGMKGVKLKLKGKVSVAGNARTRSIYYRVGNTGQSTLNSKVLHNLTFFYTFTGILGLQIWFYF